MKIIDYLDAAKTKYKSDSAVGRLIGKEYRDIWAYRKKGITPDAETCTKLALILDIEPMEVISSAGIESAKTEKSREFWSGFFMQLKARGASTGQPRFLDSCANGDSGTTGKTDFEGIDVKAHYAK